MLPIGNFVRNCHKNESVLHFLFLADFGLSKPLRGRCLDEPKIRWDSLRTPWTIQIQTSTLVLWLCLELGVQSIVDERDDDETHAQITTGTDPCTCQCLSLAVQVPQEKCDFRPRSQSWTCRKVRPHRPHQSLHHCPRLRGRWECPGLCKLHRPIKCAK